MKYGSSVRWTAVRKSVSLLSKCQKISAFETSASFATCDSDVLAYPWAENRRTAVVDDLLTRLHEDFVAETEARCQSPCRRALTVAVTSA